MSALDTSTCDLIKGVADENAKYLVAHKEKDMDLWDSHWVNINRDHSGSYSFSHSHSFDQFPKADLVIRSQVFETFMSKYVLPHIDKNIDVSGWYPVNYEDGCDGIKNTICYSKQRGAPNALVPDMYQQANYNDCFINFNDPFQYDQKHDKIIFAGADTGDLNPAINKRIDACIWSASNRDISEFYITNNVQIDNKVFKDYCKDNLSQIMFPSRIEIAQQLQFKYIYSIDGNTAGWDRPVWVMLSNSILFKQPSEHLCWYYDMLGNGVHYIESDTDSLRKNIEMIRNRPDIAKQITWNAKSFSQTYCTNKLATTIYTKELFEAASIRNKA